MDTRIDSNTAISIITGIDIDTYRVVVRSSSMYLDSPKLFAQPEMQGTKVFKSSYVLRSIFSSIARRFISAVIMLHSEALYV